ncbi:EAP30/Vps36 family protein [Trifolium repens]|nr:EAP30/Vps36 family protein [Trifolium repens]
MYASCSADFVLARLNSFSIRVQIVDICLATRPLNGGLINLQELCNLLRQRRKSDRGVVSEDDCLCAISKLKVLGSGFEVISVGKKKLVRLVPTELNKHHNEILELAQVTVILKLDMHLLASSTFLLFKSHMIMNFLEHAL